MKGFASENIRADKNATRFPPREKVLLERSIPGAVVEQLKHGSPANFA